MSQSAARKTLVVPVPVADFHATVVDYHAYPHITDEVKTARVLSRTDHVSIVHFTARVVMKTFDYTLRMVEAPTGDGMSWTLVSSSMLTMNEGRWTLEALGPRETRVTYEAALGAKLWLPNSVLTSLSSVVLPRVLKRWSEYAQGVVRDRQACVA